MTEHILERTEDQRFRCSVCNWDWQTKPRTECPGLPRYQWREWPEHLVLKDDLFARGLRLAEGQQPVAVVGSTKTDFRPLYDVREAVALEKIIEFNQGKYAFEAQPDGFTIWRINGLRLDVRYEDTWLRVGKERLGVYQYKPALAAAATWFAEQVLTRADEGEIEQAAELIQGALKRRFYEQWQRLVNDVVPPEVAALARLMWASTQGDANVLHFPELYTPRWQYVRQDLRQFHACRMFAKTLDAINTPATERESLLQILVGWRQALTPTVPNKALNKTLDKLPVAISYGQITRLSTIQLTKPITSRLHLVFVLCASDHHNWGLHERTVLDATPELIQEVGRLYGRELKTMTKTRIISHLATQILDYPEAYNGDLLGLARRSQEWHVHFDRAGEGHILPADTPLARPQGVDLADLERQGVTLLRTAGDCYREHEKMRHCVHTYASKAAKGLCYLFHVDHQVEGVTYPATIEVSPHGYVTQAHGPENMKNPACHYGVEVLHKAFKEGSRALRLPG